MHTDPELLSLLALHELAGTDEERAHTASCPTCSAELTELSRVVLLGRSVRNEDVLVQPSSDLWARISGELALDLDAEESTESLTRAEEMPIPEIDGDLMAEARLAPVDASWAQASGAARLTTDGHGRRVLQVALHADLPSSGLRQAWLVHRDDPRQRQSVGMLDGLHGLWTVDHAVDLEQFAILDISLQGLGDTEHSGRSLVRGELALVS